jgi:hypothetical protein
MSENNLKHKAFLEPQQNKWIEEHKYSMKKGSSGHLEFCCKKHADEFIEKVNNKSRKISKSDSKEE